MSVNFDPGTYVLTLILVPFKFNLTYTTLILISVNLDFHRADKKQGHILTICIISWQFLRVVYGKL